jgi:threonine synthase
MDVAMPNNWTRIEALLGPDPGAIRDRIAATSVTDAETLATMRAVEARTGYVLDPHSSVAVAALERTLAANPGTHGIALATADPAKFEDAIREGLGRARCPSGIARAHSFPPASNQRVWTSRLRLFARFFSGFSARALDNRASE